MANCSTKVRAENDILAAIRKNGLTFSEADYVLKFVEGLVECSRMDKEYESITNPETGKVVTERVRDVSDELMDYEFPPCILRKHGIIT